MIETRVVRSTLTEDIALLALDSDEEVTLKYDSAALNNFAFQRELILKHNKERK